MFAGPNGSGKTTVKNSLRKTPKWFGLYINPDDLEADIRKAGFVSLEPFGLTATTDELRGFFSRSKLLARHSLDVRSIVCRDGGIDFAGVAFTSYHASVLSDYLRRRTLDARRSLSFETVMSAVDKVELMREAQELGYRTYLYYVATDDPTINLQRVRNRFADGGHDVPGEKVVARYYRSLSLLPRAVRYANRAYFFDTTHEQPWYFAEATNGVRLDLKSTTFPVWFDPVWERFESPT